MNWFKRLFIRKEEVVPQKTASELLYELRRKRKILSYSAIDSKEYRETKDAIKGIESEILSRPDEWLNPLNPLSPLYMGRDWQGIDNSNHYTDYPSNNDTENSHQSNSHSHDSGSTHSHSHDTGSSSISDSTSYDSGSSFSSDSTSYDSGSSYSSDY